MNTFFTSDLHLGHTNIIEYCKRPFKDTHDMNVSLVNNWNSRVKPDDTVYHLGDFCFRGGVQGGRNKAQFWEEKLNGKIIHVKGNHDVNNGTKSILTHALFEFGGKVVLGVHKPPTHDKEIPDYCDFVLCGHVHEKWKFIIFNNRPVINVGVDMWNFTPIKLQEILVFYDKIVMGLYDDRG